MEVLGHSQISLTMNTFSHVLPTLKREAAQPDDELLRGGRGRGDGAQQHTRYPDGGDSRWPHLPSPVDELGVARPL